MLAMGILSVLMLVKEGENLVEHDCSLKKQHCSECSPEPGDGRAHTGALTLDFKAFRASHDLKLKTQIQGDGYSMGTQLCFSTASKTCRNQ